MQVKPKFGGKFRRRVRIVVDMTIEDTESDDHAAWLIQKTLTVESFVADVISMKITEIERCEFDEEPSTQRPPTVVPPKRIKGRL